MKTLLLGFLATATTLVPMVEFDRTGSDLHFVRITGPNNQADENGYGHVPYSFRITPTPITNRQYAAFLNAVDPEGQNGRELYNSQMGLSPDGGIRQNAAAASGKKYQVRRGSANRPVAFVNWNDAARFANWLTNGGERGSSSEVGTYNLREGTLKRSSDARYWVPSEDELYKAAYYLPSRKNHRQAPSYLPVVGPGTPAEESGAIDLPIVDGLVHQIVDVTVPPRNSGKPGSAEVSFAGRLSPDRENGFTHFHIAGSTEGIIDDEESSGETEFAGLPEDESAFLSPPFPFPNATGLGNLDEPPPAS